MSAITQVTHLPADISLSFQYRDLVAAVGELRAAFLFHRLWSDLAFQSRVHGKAGVYAERHLPYFLSTLLPAGDPDASFQALLDSRLLILKDGDAHCPIFADFNLHLDCDWIPPTAAWRYEWNAMVNMLAEDAGRATHRIPKLARFLPDGGQASDEELRRALWWINTLDRILMTDTGRTKGWSGRGKGVRIDNIRDVQEIPIPTFHRAVEIVRQHSDAALSVILRRFLSLSRPRLNPMLPPTTEEALERFDSHLLPLLTPDEGFEAWIKQVDSMCENPELYADDQRDEDIKRELRGHNRKTVNRQYWQRRKGTQPVEGG